MKIAWAKKWNKKGIKMQKSKNISKIINLDYVDLLLQKRHKVSFSIIIYEIKK